MDRALNTENLSKAMELAGLSQTALAKKLDVSKEAVSKWLKGRAYPRPDKLLRLALAVDLGLNDLIVRSEDSSAPVIAFRKRGATKTTEGHVLRAQDMGRMLTALVPYLPYDALVRPSTLKEPELEYDYIQQVASKIRFEIGVGPGEELSFSHLIRKFNELQAVIVPVLWGKKDKHENALHIYLPDSMTTWVYLNLDVNAHDFKFWMAHELSHVYTPDLRGDLAEDFADALAGALVFPKSLAVEAYEDVCRTRSEKSRIQIIRNFAERYAISMVSVYFEINKYAANEGLPKVELGDGLYKSNTRFNQHYPTISQTLFDDGTPDASDLIDRTGEVFGSPFFQALKAYLAENPKSAGFIQSILDIPLLDAKGIYAELS